MKQKKSLNIYLCSCKNRSLTGICFSDTMCSGLDSLKARLIIDCFCIPPLIYFMVGRKGSLFGLIYTDIYFSSDTFEMGK